LAAAEKVALARNFNSRGGHEPLARRGDGLFCCLLHSYRRLDGLKAEFSKTVGLVQSRIVFVAILDVLALLVEMECVAQLNCAP
jgi:hypothetical protein